MNEKIYKIMEHAGVVSIVTGSCDGSSSDFQQCAADRLWERNS